MNPDSYPIRPDLPEALAELRELALDLRWSWSHVADALWRRIDAPLWRHTRNPWLILQTVSRRRLAALADDDDFRALLQRLREEQRQALAGPTWFDRHHGDSALAPVAYFCMEYGLSEALPLYSGGLGVLAGDHLKTCSELGVPLLAVGLLYQQGYFRQGLDPEGRQLAFYPYNDPTQLPVVPVRDADGEWVSVTVELPGRALRLRAWQAQVGRVTLYLLDSNDPLNDPADRGITSELYGGGPELRLQQEIVLGIGGHRLLQALDRTPAVCHLNEGHAAFAVLERARAFAAAHGLDFATALTATRAGNLFTTHTPVEAGFDRFAPRLLGHYLADWAAAAGLPLDELLALGRGPADGPDAPFNMAWLAIHGSGAVNGVSRLHGAVSRRLFQGLFPRWPTAEVPVGHVTNGVHTSSWDAPAADRLWTEAGGKERWREDLKDLEQAIGRLPDQALWEMRTENRARLVRWVRSRRPRHQIVPGNGPGILDPNVLTIGFARRFVAYKRPNLLLHDRDRLARLLTRADRPVQLVLAGKAHPADRAGQALLQEWIRFIRDYRLQRRIVFLVDYDLLTAAHLVAGVDLWLNTPRRPWEACGTSGMKVLVNGGLNLSELDGWWAEAWRPEVGWALGDGREHGDDAAWDAREADALYELLENEVIPLFYRRDEHGIPGGWIERMRHSMAELTPAFSTNRMVREYTERHYLPLAAAVARRCADGAALARDIQAWRTHLATTWHSLRFGDLQVQRTALHYHFSVAVYLGDVAPDAVRVELYADPAHGRPRERHAMLPSPLPGAVNGFLYRLTVPAQRPAGDYTPRVVPHHPEAAVPLEEAHILWQR